MIWSYVKRNLWRRKSRSIAMIVTIGIVVGMIGGFSIATKSTEITLQHYIASELGGADIIISNSTGLLKLDNILDIISNVSGVEKIDYVLGLNSYLYFGGKTLSISVVGVGRGFYAENLLGSLIDHLEGNSTVITNIISETLELGLGDRYSASMYYGRFWSASFYVAGIYNWTKKFKWETPRFEVYVDLEALWNITGLDGRASMIYIKVSEEQSIEEVISRLRVKLKDLNIESIGTTGIQQFVTYYALLVAFPIVSAVVLLFAINYMNIDERRQEFGVLKVFGAKPSSIIVGLLIENLILAILGVLLGIGLSVIIGYIFIMLYSTAMLFGSPATLYIDPQSLTTGIYVGLLVPLITTLLMAKIIANLKPVEILSEETRIEKVGVSKGLKISGAVFLILGILSVVNPHFRSFSWALYTSIVILAGSIIFGNAARKIGDALMRIFGLPGKLAVVFSRRRINTVIGIIILLTSAMSFVAITRSISNAYMESTSYTVGHMNYDAIVSFSNPISWEEGAKLSEINQIEDYLLVGWLGYVSTPDGASISIIVVNMERLSQFLDFEIVGGSFEEVKNESFGFFDIALTTNDYLKTLTNEPLGHNLTINTEKGKTNITCRLYLKGNQPLVWFFIGPAPLGQSILVDRSFAEKYYPNRYRFLVFGALVKFSSGASREAIQSALDEKYGKYMAEIYTLKDWEEESARITQAFSGFFYLIGYIIMLISAFLLFVVQLRNIETWRREIGTLVAFGLSRKALIKIFVIQALLLVLIALASYSIAYPYDTARMEENLKTLRVRLAPDWIFLGAFSIGVFFVLTITALLAIIKILRTPTAQLLEEE